MPVDWYVIYIFITPLWVSSHTLLTLVIFPLTTLTTVNAEKIPTMKCATLDFQVFLRLLGAAPLARSPSVSAPTMPASFPHRDGATNSTKPRLDVTKS